MGQTSGSESENKANVLKYVNRYNSDNASYLSYLINLPKPSNFSWRKIYSILSVFGQDVANQNRYGPEFDEAISSLTEEEAILVINIKYDIKWISLAMYSAARHGYIRLLQLCLESLDNIPPDQLNIISMKVWDGAIGNNNVDTIDYLISRGFYYVNDYNYYNRSQIEFNFSSAIQTGNPIIITKLLGYSKFDLDRYITANSQNTRENLNAAEAVFRHIPMDLDSKTKSEIVWMLINDNRIFSKFNNFSIMNILNRLDLHIQ